MWDDYENLTVKTSKINSSGWSISYPEPEIDTMKKALERLERKITLMQQIIEVQGQEIQELKSKGDIK